MNRSYLTSILVSLLFIVSGLLAVPVNVKADNIGLTIQPVKISHTIEKGGKASGVILLSNASQDKVRVTLKTEDFVPNSGGDGVKFVSRAPGVTTVRDWITLNDGVKEIILNKNEKRAIPYTINAPANAEPGSHFGVTFFEANRYTTNGEQLRIGTQVGTLVFVTVPGNFLQKGRILSFETESFVQKPPLMFRIGFENTGTVHFEPKGYITLRNIFGTRVAEIPVEGQIVLPTGIKTLQVPYDVHGFMFGRYTADVTIVDGEGNNLTAAKVSFWVIPVWYLVAMLVGVAFLYALLRFIKSRISFSISIK